MVTEIAERIEVGAIFRRGRAKPVWFVWKGRKHLVKQITYEWQEKRGETLHHFFQLLADAGVYQISLDSKALTWSLEKVYDELPCGS